MTTPSCTRFERYLGPDDEVGWTAHLEGCPDCQGMRRRHERVIAAVQAPGRFRGPRPDWQDDVFSALESRQKPLGRRIRLRFLTAACVAAAIIIVAWYVRLAHDRVVVDQHHERNQRVLPPPPAALFGRAKALLAQGNRVEALPALRRFLAGNGGSATERAEAIRLIQGLESQLSDVDIRCDLPGISIFVDGEFRGMTPLSEPLVVTPGTHLIQLRKGGDGWARSMTFHAGKNSFYVPTRRTE